MPCPESHLALWRSASRQVLVKVASAAEAEAKGVLQKLGLPQEGLIWSYAIAADRAPSSEAVFDAAMTLVALAADRGDPACRAVLLAQHARAYRGERIKDWTIVPHRSHGGKIAAAVHRHFRRRSRWPRPLFNP